MKTFTTCFILLCLTLNFFPQAYGQARISGQVLEKEDKVLSFANVVLLAAKDSALVKAVVTGQSGGFVLDKVSPGHYVLFISMVGFTNYYKNLQPTKEDLLLGSIHLKEN